MSEQPIVQKPATFSNNEQPKELHRCMECGKPCPPDVIVHPSCAGFREWIKRGGTLD